MLDIIRIKIVFMIYAKHVLINNLRHILKLYNWTKILKTNLLIYSIENYKIMMIHYFKKMMIILKILKNNSNY